MSRRSRVDLGTFTGNSAPVILGSMDAAFAFIEAGSGGSTVHFEALVGSPGSESWARLGSSSVVVPANTKEVWPLTVLNPGMSGDDPRFPMPYTPGTVRVVQTAGDAAMVKIEMTRTLR